MCAQHTNGDSSVYINTIFVEITLLDWLSLAIHDENNSDIQTYFGCVIYSAVKNETKQEEKRLVDEVAIILCARALLHRGKDISQYF